MEINAKLKNLRNSLNLSVSQISKICNTPERTVGSYERAERQVSVEYLHALNKNFNVNLNWLVTGQGSMFLDSTQSSNIPNDILDIINQAYSLATQNKTEDEFKQKIEHFVILQKIEQKFKNIGAEKGFWEKILIPERRKIDYILMLGKPLSSLNKDKVDITIQNAKEILIDLVKNYQLRLIQDKIGNLMSESRKQEVIAWIKNEIDDLDAFVILNNIPSVLDLFKEIIKPLHKNTF